MNKMNRFAALAIDDCDGESAPMSAPAPAPAPAGRVATVVKKTEETAPRKKTVKFELGARCVEKKPVEKKPDVHSEQEFPSLPTKEGVTWRVGMEGGGAGWTRDKEETLEVLRKAEAESQEKERIREEERLQREEEWREENREVAQYVLEAERRRKMMEGEDEDEVVEKQRKKHIVHDKRVLVEGEDGWTTVARQEKTFDDEDEDEDAWGPDGGESDSESDSDDAWEASNRMRMTEREEESYNRDVYDAYASAPVGRGDNARRTDLQRVE